MKTKYLLLELEEPVEIDYTRTPEMHLSGHDGRFHESAFTIKWVHTFEEGTTAVKRMAGFLEMEEEAGAVTDV